MYGVREIFIDNYDEIEGLYVFSKVYTFLVVLSLLASFAFQAIRCLQIKRKREAVLRMAQLATCAVAQAYSP